MLPTLAGHRVFIPLGTVSIVPPRYEILHKKVVNSCYVCVAMANSHVMDGMKVEKGGIRMGSKRGGGVDVASWS